ncbi:hypothetical protein OHD50_21440 [Escherichia coli]|nr:hypothetical protein [Escherichia coli]
MVNVRIINGDVRRDSVWPVVGIITGVIAGIHRYLIDRRRDGDPCFITAFWRVVYRAGST